MKKYNLNNKNILDFIKYKINHLTCFLCILTVLPLCAQNSDEAASTDTSVLTISGHVVELIAGGQQQPLVGANVYWVNSTKATTTDLNGQFSLQRLKGNNQLVVSFTGYENDTIAVEDNQNTLYILLHSGVDLQTVEVRAKRQGTFISELKPIKTEIITTQELRRAACCNLSESFETNASVEVNYADAVSGAKEIRMLGLDGAYSQILNEGIPSMRGLANTYGLQYVPGTWMHSIQITKGSGSVVNGYEPITGQINIEYKKPENSERLHLNLYSNHEWRVEGNANFTQRINKRWATMLLLHGSGFNRRLDHNHDGFMDMPLNTIYTAMNRWKYQGEKMESMFGIKGVYDKRIGGQMTFDAAAPHNATDNGYGIGIDTRRVEAWAKTGFFFAAPYKSIGTMVSAVFHKQDMYFGLRNYSGEEINLFANFIYQTRIINCDNELKLGVSYMFDNYNEQSNAEFFVAEPNGLHLKRRESVPGVFVEYTRKGGDKFTLVAGSRLDYHNLYGLYYTPRLHLRYKLSPKTTLRASAGRGFRTTVLFAENTAIFASGRHVVFPYKTLPDQTSRIDLKPEVAWNYGINLTQKFKLADREGFVSLDVYRTDFENQVIADLFSNTSEIRFYNLSGKSFANSIQIESNYELLKGLDLKLAYKFDDVRSTYDGGKLLRVPYQPRHKALASVGYKTPDNHWRFDFTTQWHGSRQLAPLAGSTQNENIAALRAPDYFIFNGQITFAVKDWEFYAGGENLSNFSIHHPIANNEQPFSNTFDATQIWGPVFGVMGYAGLRYTLK